MVFSARIPSVPSVSLVHNSLLLVLTQREFSWSPCCSRQSLSCRWYSWSCWATIAVAGCPEDAYHYPRIERIGLRDKSFLASLRGTWEDI